MPSICLIGLTAVVLAGEIEVTIAPVTNLVALVESGLKPPNMIDTKPEDLDFFVCVRNTSTNSLRFFEEWNSWGYENLKLVCDNGWHQYWIVKRQGTWPRNFPSSHEVAPGTGFLIPVTLDTNTWSGIIEAQADTNATIIRALYEQFAAPTNPRPYYPGIHWNGSQSSKYYKLDDVMNKTKKDKNSNKTIEGSP